MLIDGRKISRDLLEKLKQEVEKLPFKPLFCDVLVGDDPVSASYVRIKGRNAEKIGMGFKFAQYDGNITQENLIEEIKKLNQSENICGLIVQLPLPPHLDKQAILDAIDPGIDVDCIGKTNSEKFYAGDITMPPPTAAAVMEMLDRLNLDLSGKNILMVGRGELVGRPAKFLLEQRGLAVNIVNRQTPDITVLTKPADVIISAAGKARLITGDIIKPGCVVIDAGTSESDGGIVGDMDFESVSKVAGFVSPVPGGVGPVTVAKLLQNVLTAARNKTK